MVLTKLFVVPRLGGIVGFRLKPVPRTAYDVPRLRNGLWHMAALAFCLLSGFVAAQEVAMDYAKTNIAGRAVTIEVPAGVEQVVIPNLHAPMRKLDWEQANDSKGKLELAPLVDAWRIKVAKSDEARTVKLVLGDRPLLTKDLTAIKPRPDGGFDLPAHLARVVGDKLRYEPQPRKNTVGYWVGPDDYAYFILQCNKPGKFNVGILQGCGKGQGGSDVAISLHGPVADGAYSEDQQPVGEAAIGTITFQAEETGHFQNFKWRHVGELSMATKDTYAIKVAPTKIAKTAVMDVRAISLTRIPE